MEIKLSKIAKSQPEQVEIRCHEITEQIQEIVTFVKSRQGQLTGIMEGMQYEIPVIDIYYVEAVEIQSIKPALNGRFCAILQSGEEIMISRKYVPELKKALKGGEC